MAFQAVTHSHPLPRWQSNWPVSGVPTRCVRLHEFKPQKTWCLRSKKSSGYGAEDIRNLKAVLWDTDDSKEESGSEVIASEDYNKIQNGKTLEEDGSLEALLKLLLVEAAAQKDMIAAQRQMIVDLQRRVAPSSELRVAQEQMIVDLERRVSPSSELTDANDQRILDLQRRVEQLEFNAAQQQMIADLQQKVAKLELDAELKSKTKTPQTEIHEQSKSERKIPPTENHVSRDGETDKQREKNPLVYFPASLDKEEHKVVKDDYAMAAMKALQKLDLNAESKSKTETPPTENHVSRYGETDDQREENPPVYFRSSSDKEEHTGVQDDYAMAALNALQRMQLDLNAVSKSNTKTPAENHVSGDGETDEQREENPPVDFPASSDKEENTGVKDEYTMAAMKAFQKLDLNAELKSKTKTPPTENHVSHDGVTDEQCEKNPLVYFPASSDKEEHTGVTDDYSMAAMNALQKMQLDLNAESKPKTKSETKTPPAENHVSSGETEEQRETNPLVYFPASSDKEEPTGVNDDYAMAAMNALQRMQLDLNAESKPKTKSETKTPPAENHVSSGETEEQRERNPLVYFPASSDKEEPTGVNDDYAMAAMNALQRMQLDLNAESKPKTKSETKTPPAENHVSSGETEEQRERNPLVYFPASSDKEEPTGVNDDYAMAAMNALQRMQLDLNAVSKSNTKTPPAENHVSSDGETDEQREENPPVYFPASSDKEEHTGVKDDYTMAAMKAFQKLDLNAESKSKTKTPPTENHVSHDGVTDEQCEKNTLVYFPASSDKEEHTGVTDDYSMAAMNALQRMQLDLNSESKSKTKSKTKTPPAENHVSSDGETDEQRERNPVVYSPASSDKEEHTGVTDDYAMAAMNALQRMQLDLNAESKSNTKTPPAENHVSSDGETDEKHERNPLVYFPAASDKEELTGVNDDYAMAAMNALQGMQLDPNAETKSKMGTSLKTPQTETHMLNDGETDEEELSSDEDELREKTPLVNFSASSDGEEQSGFRDDDYTTAVMNVLLRTQSEQNAESKSKMETPLKTPQTEIQLGDGETDEEEHSSDIDEQCERTQLVDFSASSDEEKHAEYKDGECTNAVMNQISKPPKMRFSRKPRKNVINEVHLRD